jgi:hypothetical protein
VKSENLYDSFTFRTKGEEGKVRGNGQGLAYFKALYQNLYRLQVNRGFTVAQQVVRYQPAARGFYSRLGHWDISLISSFRLYYYPGVDSASNRNEYQECRAVEVYRRPVLG